MSYLPDERFKHTTYDLDDCMDAIINGEVEKESEKKKAIRMFRHLLDFCREYGVIDQFDLAPLEELLTKNDNAP